MTERQKEIIIALAENDMNQLRTSKAIYYSLTSLRYHIRKIKEQTGLDPNRFFDLAKLFAKAKGC